MTTVHAQTGIKLATKPAKTSLLGGHFIYKVNNTPDAPTPSSANVVEWVDNDPALWRHNVHIGSNGIKLRYGETTLSKWDTSSLIFYRPTTTNGVTTVTKGIEVTNLGIDIFGGQSDQNPVASFGELAVIGAIANGRTRTVIYDEGFRFIRRDSNGADSILVNFKVNNGAYGTNPVFTMGSRKVPTNSDNYDNTKTYKIGDVCKYNQINYVCQEEITVAENFDSSKWKIIEGENSFAFGYKIIAAGQDSMATGDNAKAIQTAAHAEGSNTIANGNYSHVEGKNSIASGFYSHAEGYSTTASASSSHSEGESTAAEALYSHAEGTHTIARGTGAHAEGYYTTAGGNYSHAEGYYAVTSGIDSHAEGYHTTTYGNYSHAEGAYTRASGAYSHAEGYNTQASGDYSHAMGNSTIAAGAYQTVVGTYNISDNTSPFIIGNGTSDSSRSNLFAINSAGDLEVSSNFWIINKDDSNNYLKISSSNLEFFKNVGGTSTSIASFGSTSRIGPLNNKHISIDSNGMYIYTGSESSSTQVASFTSSQIMLKSSTGSIEINSNGLNLSTTGSGTSAIKFNGYPLITTYILKYKLNTTITHGQSWKIRQSLPPEVTNDYSVLGVVGYNFDKGTSQATSSGGGISLFNVWECNVDNNGTYLYFSARNMSSTYDIVKGIIINIILLVTPKLSNYSPGEANVTNAGGEGDED